jgi:cysteine desulfurase family protein (TIGR01976 family)
MESRTLDQLTSIDTEQIREQFPALKSKEVFLDNAGGSQLPGVVIDRIQDFMINEFVQLGADYNTSRVATLTIEDAHAFVEMLMNGVGLGKVILGPSTSALCAMLADCYARALDPKRNEVIVCESGHEANISPWARLANRGYTVKTWRVDKDTFECPISSLRELLSERTRILAVPHVSNILGKIEDVKEIGRLAHEVGARIVVDGVAYSPHRAMDVADWDVDWYVYSTYKVYGPHMAAMFGTNEAISEIEGPNFFFVDPADVPYKFELGGVLYEGCAGVLGLKDYLNILLGRPPREEIDRQGIEKAFDIMTAYELPLQKQLIEYLIQKDKVRIIGPSDTGASRVCTISFVHESKTSKEIVLAANDRGIGIRYGHFYAYYLAVALGLDPDDGVVRTSLVHYNSREEIDRLIECFEDVL